MPQIDSIISSQKFELIRDRIADILIDEINGQAELGNDVGLSALYVENHIPIDNVKLPAIVVSIGRASYQNKSQISVDGSYDFYIDVFSKGVAGDTKNGDAVASLKVQKIVGMVRAILENPAYMTLGFAKPFSCRSIISEINFGTIQDKDEKNVQMARMTFNIVAPESVNLREMNVIYEYATSVRIADSNAGYLFSGSGIVPDADACSPAILNINGTFHKSINSGSTFDLNVVDQDGNAVGSPDGENYVVNTTGGSGFTLNQYIELLNIYE